MFKVLIADDEQIVLEGIKFVLEDIYDDVEVVAMLTQVEKPLKRREILYQILC